MSDSARPQLELGTPPGNLGHAAAGGAGRWIWLLILLQLLTLVLLGIAMWRPQRRSVPPTATAPAEDLRTVALLLEDRSLDGPAAVAWQQYLQQSPTAEDRAEILYRIGKLQLRAGSYDEAAAALVRAERAAGDDQQLRERIGPQLITCLRRLGLYGEVGRELSRQVEAGADQTGQGQVLATVAGESVTDADLDRMIEQRVDQQLSLAGATDDQATREMLLRQLSQPRARQQLLGDLLRRELFTRRARELELDRTDDFVRQRQLLEDDLLASRFERQELETVQPTRVDLEAFFAANRDQYLEPERIDVLYVPLESEDKSEDVLRDVSTADDFRALVAEHRGVGSEAADELETVTVTRGRRHRELGDVEPLFQLDAETWTRQPHAGSERDYLVLIVEKTPARTPSFDEVAAEVEAEYRARKRREILERAFRELMGRYDVQLHSPASDNAPADSPARENTPSQP